MGTVSPTGTNARSNPFIDPQHRPPGMVAMRCMVHSLFVRWCHPPTPLGIIGCSPSCPPVGQLALFPVPRTSPARFDTGQSGVAGAGSRVDGVDHEVTPVGALDAGPDALDDRPVAEGAEPAAAVAVEPVEAPTLPMHGDAL